MLSQKQTQWLSSTHRIQKKFMKTFFHLKDNILDKRLTAMINQQQFVLNRKAVLEKVTELVGFYAQHFTRKNDKAQAQKELESRAEGMTMRKKDAVLISYFCGAISIIVFMIITLLSIPDSSLKLIFGQVFDSSANKLQKSELQSEQELLSSMHTFRFLLMLIFVLVATGYVVKYLRVFQINYIYIFDLDPQYKITHAQLFKVATGLFALWSFFFLGQTFLVKMEFVFESTVAICALGVLISFVIACIQPFHFCYKKGRVVLAHTIWNILISPFGQVKFKHFFLADIVTSMVQPLRDFGFITCYYSTEAWAQQVAPSIDKCPWVEEYLLAQAQPEQYRNSDTHYKGQQSAMGTGAAPSDTQPLSYLYIVQNLDKVRDTYRDQSLGLQLKDSDANSLGGKDVPEYLLAIVFLPFWFRLAQCFRRYSDTKMKIHLANAAKYFSVILIHFANIFKTLLKTDTTLYIFLSIHTLSTLFSYSWDLYMDWGILRSKEPGKKYLRPKILLPPWFYYYAIVSNLILRFAWLLSYSGTLILPQWAHGMPLVTFLMFAEGFRRAQWALIRLENEQVNNFEKYRTILEIPPLKIDTK